MKMYLTLQNELNIIGSFYSFSEVELKCPPSAKYDFKQSQLYIVNARSKQKNDRCHHLLELKTTSNKLKLAKVIYTYIFF